MRLFANPTVRSGIPPEDKGAIRRQGCRPQKKRLIIPSSTGGGREPPRAAGLLNQQRLRRFGDVALCARIPQSGRFEALSSPSGCFMRTLRGHSAMRPTVGHLALHPRSVRARRAGRRTSSRARPGQIRLRPRSVRPNRPTGPHTGASSFLSETRTDKATSPKRPRSVRGPPLLKRDSISAQTRRAGPTPPRTQKGRRPGMRATAWGGEGGGSGGRRSKGRGPPRAPRPEPGRGPGGKGPRSPRSARGRAPRPAGG